MNENEQNKELETNEPETDKILEFSLSEAETISSAATISASADGTEAEMVLNLPEPELDAEVSPVFKELASPKLPELPKENRAQLLMQTPNRLYFYWSSGKSPFQTLNQAIRNGANGYSLIVKLINLNTKHEEMHAVSADGSWWFNVEANTKYQAEIGFFATNRPYVRVMYSNTVETPRKSPSPRFDTEADWNISSEKFAEVLEVAGFSQDAFDVAIAGDDVAESDHATHRAFIGAFGRFDLSGIAADEIRFALLAIAAGADLEYLRYRISPTLFALLANKVDKFDRERTFAALREHFDIEANDFDDIIVEESGAAVFGASLVNFPRIVRKMRQLPQYFPAGSHSLLQR